MTTSTDPVTVFDFQALSRLNAEDLLESLPEDEPEQLQTRVEAMLDWGFFRRAEQRAVVRRRNLRAAE